MRVLVLGGTGAMGKPLCEALAKQSHKVFCTSRSPRVSSAQNIKYLLGNAREESFVSQLTDEKWDVIVDFMVYTTQEFKSFYKKFLNSAKQYVFISSARVYAESSNNAPIKETHPRLLDVCEDKEYLKTDEYALSKARQEDILENSNQKNYTIIRPSITYNTNRLQLGGFEKEEWLYRALQGRSIVFSKDLINKVTTMTLGDDVVKGICSIIGKESAYGEAFHITENNSYTWGEILEVYLEVLQEKTGKRPKVKLTDKSILLKFRRYQMIYCKLYNRRFDCSKIAQYADIQSFTSAKEGLKKCLSEFLDNVHFQNINFLLEAKNDISAKEFTSLSEISGKKAKIKYIVYRFGIEKIIQKTVGLMILLKRKISN